MRSGGIVFAALSLNPRVRHQGERLRFWEMYSRLLEDQAVEANARAAEAHEDAQDVFQRAFEMVTLLRLYQASLDTLCAPDPHRGRFDLVVTQFFRDFIDLYHLKDQT